MESNVKTKILHFKFKKRNNDIQTESNSVNKNYECIYNNILNGVKTDKTPDNYFKNMQGYMTINTKSKNKIKHISKLNSFNPLDEIKPNIIINKFEKINKEKSKNNNNENNTITSHNTKPIRIIINNSKNKNFKNQSKKLLSKKINVSLAHQFKFEKNMINDLYISSSNSHCNKTKINNQIKKKKNKIKHISAKKSSDQKISFINSKKSNEDERYLQPGYKKNNNKREVNLKPEKFLTEKNCLTQKKYLNRLKKHVYRKSDKIFKNKTNIFKKITPSKIEKFINKNQENNKFFEYFNKITIADNYKNKSIFGNNNLNKIKNINYAFNENTSEKKLILNNTNSNININININNINDNISNINKKKSEYNINGFSSKSFSDSKNFNNNITTVNIINNNTNNNNKKKNKDYHLLFYNHINNIVSPRSDKLNPKGIKIQSININLGEDLDKNNNNTISNTNYIKNNLFKEFNNTNETDKEKETKSEYELYRDVDDFFSNRSLTNFSCKSGYTMTRKLRSLSKERDKIKLLNKCKDNEKDLGIIGDKLLNIVNNFHNNSNFVENKNSNNKSEIKRISKIKNFNIFASQSKNSKIYKKKRYKI